MASRTKSAAWSSARWPWIVAIALISAGALLLLFTDLKVRSILDSLGETHGVALRYESASTWPPGVITLNDVALRHDGEPRWAVLLDDARVELGLLNYLLGRPHVRRGRGEALSFELGKELVTSGRLEVSVRDLSLKEDAGQDNLIASGRATIVAQGPLHVERSGKALWKLAGLRAELDMAQGDPSRMAIEVERLEALEPASLDQASRVRLEIVSVPDSSSTSLRAHLEARDARWHFGELELSSALRTELVLLRSESSYVRWHIPTGEAKLTGIRAKKGTARDGRAEMRARLELTDGVVSNDQPLALKGRLHASGPALESLLALFELPRSAEWILSGYGDRPFTLETKLRLRDHVLFLRDIQLRSDGVQAEGAVRYSRSERAMAILLQAAAMPIGVAIGPVGTDLTLGAESKWLQSKLRALELD